jgi:hypothetical protein
MLFWYAHSNPRGPAPAAASSNTLPHAVIVENTSSTAFNPLRERTQDAAPTIGRWMYPENQSTEVPQDRFQGPDIMIVRPPVSGGLFSVWFNHPARGYLRLINNQGKVVFQQFIDHKRDVPLELDDLLPDGAYCVELTAMHNTYLSKRIQIQHSDFQ